MILSHLLFLALFVSAINGQAEVPDKEYVKEDYSRYNIAPPPDYPPPEIIIYERQTPNIQEGCGTLYVNETFYRCLVGNGHFVSVYPITIEMAQWVFDRDACLKKFNDVRGWTNMSEMCVQDSSREVEAWSWKTDEANITDWAKVTCLIPSKFKLRYSYAIPMCFNCYDMNNDTNINNDMFQNTNVQDG
ncbi:hypothetical protein GJ496_001642 [Pomphorhynchus laevis]|nr:hypothetical protein GJ496_001642 [Pomphorhynchus laevis]